MCGCGATAAAAAAFAQDPNRIQLALVENDMNHGTYKQCYAEFRMTEAVPMTYVASRMMGACEITHATNRFVSPFLSDEIRAFAKTGSGQT
jgi:hypothetical protein